MYMDSWALNHVFFFGSIPINYIHLVPFSSVGSTSSSAKCPFLSPFSCASSLGWDWLKTVVVKRNPGERVRWYWQPTCRFVKSKMFIVFMMIFDDFWPYMLPINQCTSLPSLDFRVELPFPHPLRPSSPCAWHWHHWRPESKSSTSGGVSLKWGYPNSWMVYQGKKKHYGWELGLPLFQEASIDFSVHFPCFL